MVAYLIPIATSVCFFENRAAVSDTNETVAILRTSHSRIAFNNAEREPNTNVPYWYSLCVPITLSPFSKRSLVSFIPE